MKGKVNLISYNIKFDIFKMKEMYDVKFNIIYDNGTIIDSNINLDKECFNTLIFIDEIRNYFKGDLFL